MKLNREQMIQHGRVLAEHDEQLAEAKDLFIEEKLNLDQFTQLVVTVTCRAMSDLPRDPT